MLRFNRTSIKYVFNNNAAADLVRCKTNEHHWLGITCHKQTTDRHDLMPSQMELQLSDKGLINMVNEPDHILFS